MLQTYDFAIFLRLYSKIVQDSRSRRLGRNISNHENDKIVEQRIFYQFPCQSFLFTKLPLFWGAKMPRHRDTGSSNVERGEKVHITTCCIFTEFWRNIGFFISLWKKQIHTVDFTKFLYHDFLKNFRENNFLSKHFTK